MAQRIRYFDISRGIAIVCVVLSHSILRVNGAAPVSPFLYFLYQFCFSFHMPLFLVLSGYFMRPERPFNWGRESRELLATYGITALAVVAVNTAFAGAFHTGMKATFAAWATTGLYGAGADAANTLWPVPSSIGAIWFLLALFWSHLLLHWVSHKKYPALWVIVFFALGYFSSTVFWLPLSLQSGLTACAFVYIGYLCKTYNAVDWLNQHWVLYIIPIAIWALSIWKFTGFSVALNQYGQTPMLAFVGSICGTVSILGVSILIDRWLPLLNTALATTGRYTLPLLCVHLLEDDSTPWGRILPSLLGNFQADSAVLLIFVIRLTIDGLLAWGLYYIPGVNTIFFPELAKRRAKRMKLAQQAEQAKQVN
ncbi:acetyltransferase [Bombiscardovia nodaiensis]|uniref:Acetyltransferase n=1 Tax=Bombiscardovia nodaiensis TaxID=2932181 RepID=A0ABM8B9Q8_9BIFI|nr:acetyltransferase [Bombiscardovia nodaiensis]